MQLAIGQAQKAYAIKEVPIGAIIVMDGKILGKGFNQVEARKDPTAHAELMALREASVQNETWRLNGATLYVTVEPCPMCLSALHLARLNKIVYASDDPRFGACGSYLDLSNLQAMTSSFEITKGVLAEESSRLIKAFFSELRKK